MISQNGQKVILVSKLKRKESEDNDNKKELFKLMNNSKTMEKLETEWMLEFSMTRKNMENINKSKFCFTGNI